MKELRYDRRSSTGITDTVNILQVRYKNVHVDSSTAIPVELAWSEWEDVLTVNVEAKKQVKQEPKYITEIFTLEQVNQFPMTAKAHIDGLQKVIKLKDKRITALEDALLEAADCIRSFTGFDGDDDEAEKYRKIANGENE